MTLYFAVCSVVILLLKQLWLADYGIEFHGIAAALLPVKVAPLPTNADAGLIDVPGPAARPEMPAYSLLEFGGKALHSAVQAVVER